MRKNGDTTTYRESLKVRIMETAMSLFKQHGIKSVKMDDIATELGISKRTLYETYNNKEELLFEGVRHAADVQHKQLSAYAEKAGNEMDIVAFFLRMRLKDLGTINPLFFSEMHKYSKIIAFLQQQNEIRRTSSIQFMKRGIKNGYFRADLNYDIVSRLGEAATDFAMKTKMYQRYPLKEIFRTFTVIYLRGCCTDKGLTYLETVLGMNE